MVFEVAFQYRNYYNKNKFRIVLTNIDATKLTEDLDSELKIGYHLIN